MGNGQWAMGNGQWAMGNLALDFAPMRRSHQDYMKI
jgi:hypothetical protein